MQNFIAEQNSRIQINVYYINTKNSMLMNEKVYLIICCLFLYLIFGWFQIWCLVNPQLQNVKSS